MLIHQIKLNQSSIGDEVVQTVNARDLHKALEIKTRFNDWINVRIGEYGFLQNVDYILVTENPVTKGRGGNRKPIFEYHISLDMAKELAMVEKTAKGREVRRYFIDCEKQAYGRDLTLAMKIAELSGQIQSISNDLSIAGRVLSIGGKTIKPKLLRQLENLEQQLQPTLPFNP